MVAPSGSGDVVVDELLEVAPSGSVVVVAAVGAAVGDAVGGKVPPHALHRTGHAIITDGRIKVLEHKRFGTPAHPGWSWQIVLVDVDVVVNVEVLVDVELVVLVDVVVVVVIAYTFVLVFFAYANRTPGGAPPTLALFGAV